MQSQQASRTLSPEGSSAVWRAQGPGPGGGAPASCTRPRARAPGSSGEDSRPTGPEHQEGTGFRVKMSKFTQRGRDPSLQRTRPAASPAGPCLHPSKGRAGGQRRGLCPVGSGKAAEGTPPTTPEDRPSRSRGVRDRHRPPKGAQTRSTAPRRGARLSQAGWVCQDSQAAAAEHGHRHRQGSARGAAAGLDTEAQGDCKEKTFGSPQSTRWSPAAVERSQKTGPSGDIRVRGAGTPVGLVPL